MNGIILANRELYQGENECILVDLMNEHGFTEETQAISQSCQSPDGVLSDDAQEKKNDKQKPACGTTGATLPPNNFLFILLFLFPAIISAYSKEGFKEKLHSWFPFF